MHKEYKMLLSQGIGKASTPIVASGERVKRGQMIAVCPEGGLGTNLSSSVTGTVASISEDAIVVIADDVQGQEYEKLKSISPIECIKEAGILGLGGAGFPTHVKFSRPLEKGGVVIVNAAECEPILCHNIARMEKDPKGLVEGLKIAMEISSAERGVIAIKRYHKEAIDTLKSVIDYRKIEIFELEDMYPMGEERAIIREVIGRLLEVDQLPIVANAIVVNAETIYRIKEAVIDRKPLIDKDLTIAGKIVGENTQTFFDVPIGTMVGDLIDRAGGISGEYGELIMGGPFTGHRTYVDAPIIKTTGGIIVAETFLPGPSKIGLLVCACGANKERLNEIAKSMGSEVAGVEYCKQAHAMKSGAIKCENPGRCPGQVQKVMSLKKAGAQALLVSNCTDCTNTVMSCAPQLKLPVYHCTDGALRSVNHRLIRRIKTI